MLKRKPLGAHDLKPEGSFEEKPSCGEYAVNPVDIERLPFDTCKKMLVELSKGISHPMRLEIVRMLLNKPLEARCVCGDIVDALPLAQSSVSQHLKVLKETGWIQGTIDGPRVCYCTVGGIIEVYLSLLNRAFMPLPRDLDPLSEEIVEEGSDA